MSDIQQKNIYYVGHLRIEQEAAAKKMKEENPE